MKPRSLPFVLALIAAPLALFRRRAKDGWLGELAEIRGQALGGHEEIGPAMSGSSQDPDAGGAAMEADGPEVDAPHRVASDAEPAQATGTGSEPEPESEPAPRVPTPEGPGTAAAGMTPAGLRPPRPAPHREHPSELWHSPLELTAVRMAPEIAPEERIDPSELTEPVDGVDPRPHPFAPSRAPGAPDPGFRPEGLASFDDRLAQQKQHVTATTDPLTTDPPVDVLAGRDLVDDSEPPAHDAPVEDQASAGRSGSHRPRVGPPTDIFDVAPTALATDVNGTPSGVDDGGLVADPIDRRAMRSASRRSLFGGGEVPVVAGGDTPAIPATPATPEIVADDVARRVVVSVAGELVDEQGTIRLAERIRPEIVRTPDGDALTLDTGWCWVARARSAKPVRVSLPAGILVVPAATRALAVVESDSSTFVSVVAGTARLEHPSGGVAIASGSMAHIPLTGTVTLDTASPDEMAADTILTRNLRLDDAHAAIAKAAGTDRRGV